jgi:flagellar hook assembly protein FlgD
MSNSFALNNACPNPFNPVTTLSYYLPKGSFVTMTVYDMLGRKVKQLVNQNETQGVRSVQWNSTNDHGQPVSAGIYLCRIEAGEFRQTKKMVLLK